MQRLTLQRRLSSMRKGWLIPTSFSAGNTDLLDLPMHILQCHLPHKYSLLHVPPASLPPHACRRMWIPDATEGFLPGWIKSSSGEEGKQDTTAEVVVASTGEVRIVPTYLLSPMNPPQFDGVEDIADLTHLNEASVVSNLRLRCSAGSIYVSIASGVNLILTFM